MPSIDVTAEVSHVSSLLNAATVEHVLHVLHRCRVPGLDVLVELYGSLEHAFHVCYRVHFPLLAAPCRDGLVESLRTVEHVRRFCHGRKSQFWMVFVPPLLNALAP